MNRLYYIERYQQWINLWKIVTILRAGENWEVILEDNVRVILNDGEYANLITKMNEPPKKPDFEHKPEHKEGD